jgi:hypothetical protein
MNRQFSQRSMRGEHLHFASIFVVNSITRNIQTPKSFPGNSYNIATLIVTLPLVSIAAQFLILIGLSDGFEYASVNYTLDSRRVFLSFVLSSYFVALVGVFFLKSTEAVDSEAVIAAVLGSTWLYMWLLFWRVRQDQNFYTTLCTGGVVRAHTQRIPDIPVDDKGLYDPQHPSMLKKLNECLKKHTPKWLTLATLVSLLLLLFDSYLLSSLLSALPPKSGFHRRLIIRLTSSCCCCLALPSSSLSLAFPW